MECAVGRGGVVGSGWGAGGRDLWWGWGGVREGGVGRRVCVRVRYRMGRYLSDFQ